MIFKRIYEIRSSEINPDYSLKEHYIGMYFQECFAEYVTQKKLAAYDLAKKGLTWISSDLRIDFTPPMPLWRESVEVSVWVSKFSAARMYLNFKVSANGAEIAKGASIQLIADSQTHRPQKISDIAECFETHSQENFEDENFSKIVAFDNGCCADFGMSLTNQTVRFDDLDFNMHLNNVRYISRALEPLDLEYRLSHFLKSCRLKYALETKFGDEVKSVSTQRGNKFTHQLIRCSDGKELCAMESSWIEKSGEFPIHQF